MDDLEKTLSDLALTMRDHRDALAGSGVNDAPRPPRPRPAAPADARTALIARLLAGIETHAGLRVDEAMETKLLAGFASTGVADLEAWVTELESLDPEHPEWLTLIERLATNETYLFRDPEQLALLRTIGLAPLIAAARHSEHSDLRFWSAGCASGEEAYSLAVLALEALVGAGAARETAQDIELAAPWTLDVLGTDISRPVLAQARGGLYSTGALSPFRAVSDPLLRFFPPAAGELGRGNRLVRHDIRRHVRFAHANLLRAHAPADGCDVVACRNVLVYFTPAARKIVQAAVEAAVRPGGFLLLGPTDAPPDGQIFETVWAARAVIYRKRARP
jgi:chemotaxis protein methyltransferase CheR